MPAERDRILGELAVEHGLLSREDADRYYASLDAAPRGPALAQVLVRDGRATAQDLQRLREIWQARAAVAAVAAPAPPAAAPGGLDGESLRKDEALARLLVSRNVLTLDRAREARALQLKERQRLGPLLVRGGFAQRAEVESAVRFLKDQAVLCPTCGAIQDRTRVGASAVCTKCGTALVPAVSEDSSRIAPPPPPPPTAIFAVPSRRLGPGGEDPEAETARGMLRGNEGALFPTPPPLAPAPRAGDPFSSVREPPAFPSNPEAATIRGGIVEDGAFDSRNVKPAFPPRPSRPPAGPIDVEASLDELRFQAPGFANASPEGSGGPGSSRKGPGSTNTKPGSTNTRPGSSSKVPASVRGDPAGSGFARGAPPPAWTPPPEGGGFPPADPGGPAPPAPAWSPFAEDGAGGPRGAPFSPFPGFEGTARAADFVPPPAFGEDGAPPAPEPPARKNKKALENLRAKTGSTAPRRPAPPPEPRAPLLPVWVLVLAGVLVVSGSIVGLAIWVMKRL